MGGLTNAVPFRSFLDPRSLALPIGRFSEGGLMKEGCDTLCFFHSLSAKVRIHYITSGNIDRTSFSTRLSKK